VDRLSTLRTEQFCYLTTKGRKTGRPHTIEIWFAAAPGSTTLYMLAGGRESSDWVKNMNNDPSVSVRIGSEVFRGRGRVITEQAEDRQARKLVVAKYYGREELHSSGWEVEALPVAIDLELQ
jgi:deazaflavin-dependent oxidoreductase (nitroreductase family)